MKKFTLVASALLIAASGFAQDTIGIKRPKVFNEDGSFIYDNFAYISKADFPKSIDGAAVSYYEAEVLTNSVQRDENSESGYATSNLRHQGVGFDVDYAWRILCKHYDSSLKRHSNDDLGSEGYTFGFDVTVAPGKQFAVDAIDMDLLVEQNPIYCIDLTDDAGNSLYNSTWVTKTGSYNNHQWSVGPYIYICKDSVSFIYPDGANVAALQYNSGFEDGVGTKTPLPANLTLNAGTYHVRATIDFSKDSSKGCSFDHLFLYGKLSDADPTGISTIETAKKQDGRLYNIAGQRISKAQKGQLYIMNGKKYLQK